MKQLILLFLILNFKLLSQADFPDYSAKLFSNDTVPLSSYNIHRSLKAKAKWYASAEIWSIQKSIYSSDADTLGKDKSPQEKKSDYAGFEQQFLNSSPYEKVMFYFVDLNQDHRIDIIKTYSDFRQRPDSILQTRYPSAQEDNVTFYISTTTNYYKKYLFAGRLNSLEKRKDTLRFSCISNSCCDESVTRIDKFTIWAGASEFKREYSIWTEDEHDWHKPEGDYLPTNFIKPETYLLKEDQVIYTGVYHCQGGGRMSLPFKKEDTLRVLSKKGDYYFVEFEVRKNSNECIVVDHFYVLYWWRKSDFLKIARNVE